MKQIHGIWFPEYDTHFETVMKKDGSYQKDVLDAAMQYVKEPKIFYDIGAHVGLWSLMAISAGFKIIDAYEPNLKSYECLVANLKGKDVKGELYNFGIACTRKWMKIREDAIGNSGAIGLVECEKEEASTWTQPLQHWCIHERIHSFQIKPHETLVKIDTEGSEASCVLGMDKIIYALRPVIIVEQKFNKDALDILQKMGMEIVQQVRKDYILTWKNQ